MVTQAQLVRLGGPSRPAEEAGVAELLDPVALEARLNDARARRTEALARRAAGQAPADPRPLVPTQPELTPAESTPADLKRTVPVPADPVPVAAGTEAAAPASQPTTRTTWLIFALGLTLGGAAVAYLAQPDVRRSIALMIAPEVAPDEVVLESAPEADSPPAVVWSPPEPATLRPSAPPLPAAAPVQPVATPSAEPIPTPPAADRPVSASVEPVPATPPVTAPPAPAAIQPAIPAPPPAPAVAGTEEVDPDALPAAPQAALPPRVIIHYPASAEAAALAARDALVAAGAPSVDTVPVRFSIGASNIRYYYPADRDGAGRVAETVGATATGRPDTRDFTDYTPLPLPGVVEMWLAGTAAATARRPDPPAAAPIAAPPAAPPGSQAEAVARIIVQRSLERLSEDPPSR